eukprot:3645079-Prymnesium_polylepis.2
MYHAPHLRDLYSDEIILACLEEHDHHILTDEYAFWKVQLAGFFVSTAATDGDDPGSHCSPPVANAMHAGVDAPSAPLRPNPAPVDRLDGVEPRELLPTLALESDEGCLSLPSVDALFTAV